MHVHAKVSVDNFEELVCSSMYVWEIKLMLLGLGLVDFPNEPSQCPFLWVSETGCHTAQAALELTALCVCPPPSAF